MILVLRLVSCRWVRVVRRGSRELNSVIAYFSDVQGVGSDWCWLSHFTKKKLGNSMTSHGKNACVPNGIATPFPALTYPRHTPPHTSQHPLSPISDDNSRGPYCYPQFIHKKTNIQKACNICQKPESQEMKSLDSGQRGWQAPLPCPRIAVLWAALMSLTSSACSKQPLAERNSSQLWGSLVAEPCLQALTHLFLQLGMVATLGLERQEAALVFQNVFQQ